MALCQSMVQRPALPMPVPRAAGTLLGPVAIVTAMPHCTWQARELNPHFANGGDGVPPPGSAAKMATRPAGVGDGGTSWRLKALRRAQAAAAEEGKDVREVGRYVPKFAIYLMK